VMTSPGQPGNPMALFQGGNWAAGLAGLSANVQNFWSLYLFMLIPVVVIAVIAKKFGGRLKLTKHWTV